MERDTTIMDRKIQYYKVVTPFQIDPQIYLITFKIPTRYLFWHVGIEESMAELGKLILKCIRADTENQLRKYRL